MKHTTDRAALSCTATAPIGGKPPRCFRLPSGRYVGIACYVDSWRKLQTLPPNTLVANFDHFPTEAWRILNEIRYGIDDRINRHIPGYHAGRKWSDDWQREVHHCAHAVNTPRLIVRWIPHHLHARLAHRLYNPNDC